MATNFSNALQMNNSTAALFRAWTQFIHNTLIAGGWVNTADTGQVDLTTVAAPVAANTDSGYKIYRMADALQATAPIFMRVGYGSSAAAATPRVNLTFGSGTDGAGNLTGGGFVSNPLVATSGNAAAASNSYGAAGTSWCSFMMFVRGAANDIMIFSIERSKDSAGADTGAGILVSFGNSGQMVFTCYIIRAVGSQPPFELGVPFILSNQTGSSAFAGNVGIGIPLHFNSVVQPAGIGSVVVNSADFAAQGNLDFVVYGVSHHYQLGDSATNQVAIPTGNNGFQSRPTTRVGIRYE